MIIRPYTLSDQTTWDEFVLNHPESTNYHLINWKQVIEKTFGHKTYYLLAEEKNEIKGILPLVHMKSPLFGNFLVSLPFFNYSGVLAKDEKTKVFLLKEAINLANQLKVEHIELRHLFSLSNTSLSSLWHLKTHKVTLFLDLPDDPDILWKSFKSKLRSQIKRPQKEGMTTQIGHLNQLDNFYYVFSINMRDLGTPVYPKRFFANILKIFPDKARICTVFYNKIPVASGFIIGFKDTLEIPWASSIRKYNRYAPNMLLYWSILKYACEQGYKRFDFGRSTPNKGTYRFKKQWGPTPHQLYWYYWLNNKNKLPELNPDNPKFQLAVKIWQRLPIKLTKLIGPLIIKNIP